ncbi:MAG TPA: cation-translocating P-type ATPase, partial [Saprospiraceae bacterium]|nr:cation-translocating P-type ATPase [Saprospiraceae bacterium]
WRLMKQGIIVKQTKTVETLGSATVICTDKTGTITQNKMSLTKLFVLSSDKITEVDKELGEEEKELIRLAMWASEPIPFDPMELALHDAYKLNYKTDERPDYKMIHEYPLGGRPPMMTHVFENKAGNRIIAAKGGPEALMNVSTLKTKEKNSITEALNKLANEGYRVLAVGIVLDNKKPYPKVQQDYSFDFKGLVAFYDPPKENITAVFNAFEQAGIKIKIITGDNSATTTTILKEVDFNGNYNALDGEALVKMTDAELKKTVKTTDIFTRMFPEAKLKVINALKSCGEIVAMTGDGVNDGPALKAAHIGIAMGKKGSEIAKQASSLILVEDDLAKMIDAIAMGRKIYANLKKAIQYIISIHIPIILTVFIPLALGWLYPNIFTPVHIIFLELIMGPTCSIIYENEPMEQNTMIHKPRKFTATFFNIRELTTSIIQGIIITLGTLAIYQYAVQHSFDENTVRTMVFMVLISANIFLTMVNRSFYYSIFTTFRYKNKLVVMIIWLTIFLTILILYIPYLRHLFQFSKLNTFQLGLAIAEGFISVIWFELVKLIRRLRTM